MVYRGAFSRQLSAGGRQYLKTAKEEDLAVQIGAGWLPRLSLGSAARKPKQRANVRGKGLGAEGAFEGEGRWSYFVFSLLFSYFVEGRFDGQSAAL